MIAIYGHPFAAFAWKALIAAYARDVPFEFHIVDLDHPDHAARIAELSPTGQFPALLDGDRAVTGSNAVVQYLEAYGSGPALVPAGAEGVEVRQMADVFDDYVAQPMQAIVADALRPEGDRDPTGVALARRTLDRTYAWLDRWLADRTFAAAGRFTLADVAAAPALFYADWTQPIPTTHAALRGYRTRLLAHPAVARVVDEARPYRAFFPLGAPDRD